MEQMYSIDVVKEIKELQESHYHRGKSWEHCYVFFRNHKNFSDDEKLLDFAALHLGFFLASWGMLRGSSFLLQKDYKFYIPIIKILVQPEYDKLWDIDFLNEFNEKDIDTLFKLVKALKNKINQNNVLDGDNDNHELNLIVTKIIMATMGCIPGYDRYFKDGLKEKTNKVDFKDNLFRSLLNLINNEKDLKNICNLKQDLKGTDIKYPPMKLLDLYFWLLGRGKEQKEKEARRQQNINLQKSQS